MWALHVSKLLIALNDDVGRFEGTRRRAIIPTRPGAALAAARDPDALT
jgi:hypothetical protein